MTRNTNESYALITGASGGIGLELAKEFAKNGINLVLVARSENKLQTLADFLELEYKVKTKVIAKDLSLLEEVEALYQQLVHEKIQVDYLVNNAGFGDYALFYEADWNKLHEMINLNITALTRLSHLYVKDMLQRGFGKIMNVASTAAFCCKINCHHRAWQKSSCAGYIHNLSKPTLQHIIYIQMAKPC